MDKICKGECIYGKCPFPYCIRHRQKRAEYVKRAVGAAVLMDFKEKNIVSDKNGYGFAVDVGTTTVAAYLYDLSAVKLLSAKSAVNPQTVCGTDVLSRISYCEKQPEGLAELQKLIVKELDGLFYEMCEEARIDRSDVKYACASGNTVMLHFLAGISPVSMGTYPFTPKSLFDTVFSGEELGFENKDMKIYFPPCISAFVGADITCAVLASGMLEDERVSLLIDLGTNGEIVIKTKDGLFVTSAPAGPAFEGASIECGMAAVEGAVSEVCPFDGRLEFKVIGDKDASGICGSGLFDMIAFFLKAGAIDKTGLITCENSIKEGFKKYIVSDGESLRIQLTDKVYITQKDIREIQNAKAAVLAGIETLLEKTGIKKESIGQVYIAGGFGNAVRVSSAVEAGLIDKSFEDKTLNIGNGSAAGAVMLLLNDMYRREAREAAGNAAHIQIGGDMFFQKRFIADMDF